MGRKERHCPHELRNHTISISKSTRLVCCEECFKIEQDRIRIKKRQELRESLIESQGIEFVEKQDRIKGSDFSRAFEKCDHNAIIAELMKNCLPWPDKG